MALQESMLLLLEGLFEGTTLNNIAWSETAEENSFRAVLSNGIVRIERHPTTKISEIDDPYGLVTAIPFRVPPNYCSYDGDIYSLVFFDEKNRELARLVPTHQEHSMTLRNLWELASRRALKSEEKLLKLLHEVRNKIAHGG